MAKLAIGIEYLVYSKAAANAIYDLFNDVILTWPILGIETKFDIRFHEVRHTETTYDKYLESIKLCVDSCPDDEVFQNELAKLLRMSEDEKTTTYPYWTGIQNVILEANVPFEANVEYNAAVYHANSSHQKVYCFGKTGATLVDYDVALDAVYEVEIKQFILCLIMACVVSAPYLVTNDITVSFDGCEYQKEHLIESPLQHLASPQYRQLLSGRIPLLKSFLWMKSNSGALAKENRATVAITCLTYMLKRNLSESLAYAIIGLESVFVPERKKSKTETLKIRVNAVFPSIEQTTIAQLYKTRSKFIHGAKAFAMCDDYAVYRDKTTEIDNDTILAVVLLFATIRKLIENDATSIRFKGNSGFVYV